MDINPNKFDKICRTCLSEKANTHPIFEAFVADMLMACASVKIVESDGLPKSICNQCLQQISRSYSFKQLCERSDLVLRQCLKKSRNNEKGKQEEAAKSNESTIENKDSIEYRIKTAQLKLEISEHLKLDFNQCDYTNEIAVSEDTSGSYADNAINTNEESKGNLSSD